MVDKVKMQHAEFSVVKVRCLYLMWKVLDFVENSFKDVLFLFLSLIIKQFFYMATEISVPLPSVSSLASGDSSCADNRKSISKWLTWKRKFNQFSEVLE